jgi:hypothetical protein
MESLVTVVVILAMVALGVLVIHLLNTQHGDRLAVFHYVRDGRYGRSGMPLPGPAPSASRKVRARRHSHTRTSTREEEEKG